MTNTCRLKLLLFYIFSKTIILFFLSHNIYNIFLLPSILFYNILCFFAILFYKEKFNKNSQFNIKCRYPNTYVISLISFK